MSILPHLPARLRYWHFARMLRQPPAHDLAEIWAEVNALWDRAAELSEGQDALDRGLIDAGLDAARANERGDETFRLMREVTDEIRSQRYGDVLPCYEVSDAELADANLVPAGHPEILSAELDEGAEAELGALRVRDVASRRVQRDRGRGLPPAERRDVMNRRLPCLCNGWPHAWFCLRSWTGPRRRYVCRRGRS
jgi:hypothetical protein